MARVKARSGGRKRAAPLPVTPDGRYLVVRARLWRCADPSMDETQRQRSVTALMRARRAVRDAVDARSLARARAGVERAKRALGERGAVWWTDGAPDYNRYLVKNTPYARWFEARGQRPPTARRIEAAILEVLRERAPDASACPSDIARRLRPGAAAGWRPLMPGVREAVARLSRRGAVQATRGARVLTGADFAGGPIRIRRGPEF